MRVYIILLHILKRKNEQLKSYSKGLKWFLVYPRRNTENDIKSSVLFMLTINKNKKAKKDIFYDKVLGLSIKLIVNDI